ncbi:MAG: alpha/beta fold hydrolase [Cyanobacteria bacterium SZAS-4]|nr:alpha/beta fold hydrolase [Cyanobacteria bacterium SZAS-4]
MRIKIRVAAVLLFSVLSLFATCSQHACAKKSVAKMNYVTIPVNYVTDRELVGETFGPHRRYASDCQHHMYYGTAYVDVPNVDNKSDGELFKSLDWKVADHKPAKIATKDRIDPSNPDESKKQFISRLKKSLDQSGKSDLCLFVHGAADGFEDCTLDAAQLAYALQRPIVLYSWPSDPRRRGYFIDATDVEWSQGHFDQFLKDLMAMQAEHPLEVILVSHSMGNRLAVRSLPVVYGKGLVKDWEMVSPDIDADTCRHYILGLTQLKAKLRLYVSNKDKMLPLSQLLAGGYYRLGEASNPTFAKPGPNTKQFQRIDFTDVDAGLIGHSIPFNLISNFVDTDKPGAGLELVDQDSVKTSRFSKFAGRSHNYSHDSVESSFSKKVVRTGN